MFATVTSRLDYCNAALAGLLQATVAPLQRVQTSAARVIFKLSSREHVTPCLLQLHWLPVRWRVQFKLCCIMHSVSYGTCPAYLTNIVEPAGAGRTLPGLRFGPFNVVDRLHAAAAAHKVRGTFVFIRRTLRMERTA